MSPHSVKIAARLRPRLSGELDDDSVKVYHAPDSSSSESGSFISVANPRDLSQVFKFPFTSCYDQNSTQEEIFKNEVQPMIDVVYSGVTVTIFAYGVTSSGKTHTMQGTKSDPGVIPRTVQAMFLRKPDFRHCNVSLAMSYMEIYKDDVFDLLVTRENAPKLPVRENDAGQVFVANLSTEPISSVAEFETIYSRATKHRSTGSTNLNHASSRSHAVLTIEATMVDLDKTLTGKINLVDLAGSENNKLTGNDPSRMAESSAINKSLSVLGQVVHALNQGASRIPYRNSKLTRILQDALGGSSIGLLICNLAPGIKFRQDTLNTLNFAVRTKNIENKPVINERDNRIQPKPHLGAIHPPPPKLAPAVVQPISTSGSSSGPSRSRPSVVPNPRSSLVANAARPRMQSKVPRVSAFSGAAMGFQSFGAATSGRKVSGGGSMNGPRFSLGMGPSLTEKDIDARISKAVELEVARRMEELERERVEEERRGRVEQPEAQAEPLKTEPRESLPSGVLTPLLKRHRDLDDELKARLHDLENKFERGNKEVQLADVLSPVSKKKTGRAYVALARAHSEKGNLQIALDLYRKAENYVPDNIKLKERIIEIDWAVKNDKAFVPSPKREKKKSKAKKKSPRGSKLREQSNLMSDTPMDVDEWQDEEEPEGPEPFKQADMDNREPGRASFGLEVTNSPNKRSVAEREVDNEDTDTPPKKQRRSGAKSHKEDDASGWIPPAPIKKGKRKLGR